MHIRKLLAWALCLCLILGMIPAAAADNETLTPALTGNTGATITCSSAPLSAEVDDNDLAIVEIRGNEVRVIGKENAVGVARLTVQTASGYHIFDIPIGYTTFVFDGNTLTVIEGDSANYEVAGVNPANEEYLVGDPSYPLPVSLDADGNRVFENTDSYKLCVGLKKNGGTYVFTGTGTDGCIAVKKAAVAPTTVLLAGLDLTSSFTAPLAVKKESTTTATITALGGFVNTLTDKPFNNADVYGDPTTDGGDGTNVEYAESAVIKCKSNSQVTLNGAGTLNLNCSTKNGLKSGEYGSLTIDELTLNVNSVKNGISADNLLTINGGKISVTTTANTGDCIRSDPDAVDAAAGCAANIVINGGEFTLQADGDGIQSAQDLTINGGSFNIRAGSGYNDSSFNKDTMSRKGLKGGNPSDDENVEGTNVVTINGGEFTINTPDDAIHSDGTIVITGGDFAIQTGDDGVHGEIRADFGVQNAPDCKIHMTVSTSYEGLEAKDIYFRSGCYDITASDDGINAAGGSSNGTDPSPWGPGGGGTAGDYTLAISGGMVNVNCSGDGLDSNGAETLTGGSIIVFAQASGGDNAPLDCDGTLTVNGATVFAAGSRQMAQTPGSGSQPYVRSTTSITSGRTVTVKNNNQTVFSVKTPKALNYALYSSPAMSSSSGWTIGSDTSTPTVTRFWAEHSYGSYVQTQAPTCTVPGVRTATCSLCGDTQTQEIAPTGHSWSYVTIAPTATLEGYDLYTCATCGGQYRTNFVDPLNGPNPCQNGHTWDAGVVTVQPTCTEAGETTYTCTVCGETNVLASPAALGHDFNESTGVCNRCGVEAFTATFVCVGPVSVTAFPSQDLTTGGVPNAQTVFVRTGEGVIDVSGSGQLNFMLSMDEGYGVESITVSPEGSYNAIKYPADVGTANAYRVTKVNRSVTVTITVAEGICDHEFDENGFCIHCGLEAPKAVFTCGAGASVTAYPTQDLSTGGVPNATVAIARNSTTGEISLTGGGQVNFVVELTDGYELESLTAEPAEAYNKLNSYEGNAYRLTKVSGTVNVSVNTVYTGPAGYPVHFSVPNGVTRPADMISVPGTGITLPTVEGPEGYTFLGWVVEDYDNVETRPAEILTGSYIAPEEITLKALFSWVDGEGAGELSYELVSSAPADWTGNYVITYGVNTSMYLMKGVTVSANDSNIENADNSAAYASSGVSLSGTTLSNVAQDYLFALAPSTGSYYTIRSVATGTYVGMNTSSYLCGYTSYTATRCDWTPGVKADASSAQNAGNGSYPMLSFTPTYNYFWSGSSNTSALTSIRFWRETSNGAIIYTTIIGEAHEHTPAEPVIENELAATCTAAGSYDSVIYCAECGEELSRETVTVPALGHNPGEVVQENVVPATYEAAGSYDSVVYCQRCGAELSRETVEIPMLVAELQNGYYLIGPDWTVDAIDGAKLFAENPANADEYMLETTLAVGDQIKVVHVTNDAIDGWFPEGIGNEYTVDAAHAGEKTVYFKTSYQSAWSEFGGYIWIGANVTPSEPIETSALHIYSSISVGTDMIITFSVRKNDLTNYGKFWIEVVKHEPVNGDVTYVYEQDVLTENSATWTYQFNKIYAKEMGLDVDARLYAQDAAGQVYMSPARNANIREHLGSRLTLTNNSVEQRVLAADMLNYGAAAQLYMDYQTDHLVNEELTDEQLEKLHEYETKELPAADKTNSNTLPEGQSNILFNSMTLGNEVLLNLSVRLSENTGNVQVLVKEHDGGAHVATLDTAWSGSTFQTTFSGIGADKMRTEYDFVTLVDGVETGNIRTWSVEGRVVEIRNGSNELMTKLANALLTYGDSAAAYFAAQ